MADESALRRQMCEFGRQIYARGLVVAAEGNLSCRLGQGRFLCTPAGLSKGYMAPEDLVVVDEQGGRLAGHRNATSEVRLHLCAYRERPEIHAVVHAHSPHTTAFAVAGIKPPAFVLPEVEVVIGPTAVAEYDTPGTPGVAENAAPHIRAGANAILLSNHGVVVLGRSLEEAFFRLETLEAFCRNLLLCKQIGKVRLLALPKVSELLAAKADMGLDDPRRGQEAREYGEAGENEFLRGLLAPADVPADVERKPGPPEVVVAGHICLDLIPTLEEYTGTLASILVPGKLLDVGAAVTATGGAVPNTGLALHRFGVATALVGKIGRDLFGRAILDRIRQADAALGEDMIVAEDQSTSYTIVISPPGVDRIFLHCPGANDTFGADDVPAARLAGARLFHFGYPPLMRRMYADGGRELAAMLASAKQAGCATSLDMARPDPDSPAGQVDWPDLLRRVLPHVDVFCPNLAEILFMLDRSRFEQGPGAAERAGGTFRPDGKLLAEVAGKLLAMGPAVVMLKLGDQGAYLRTAGEQARLEALGPGAPSQPAAWAGRELFAPCFQVQVTGTTGAGDCTVAGLLAGLLKGLSPEDALTSAVATGACSVEGADATSGVPDWPAMQERIRAGWRGGEVALDLPGWTRPKGASAWFGPADRLAQSP